MQVKINGKMEETRAGTIAELVREMGLRPDGLVVEHNLVIVKQPQWAAVRLAQGDTLELLSFVGGG